MDQTLYMVVWIAILVGLFYFLMIRPGKRRAAAQKELMEALQPGSRVMLNSGMFGTIRHLGERQAVVELAPGVEITVLKQAIARPTTDDDEEFEFADEPLSDLDARAAALTGEDLERGFDTGLPAEEIDAVDEATYDPSDRSEGSGLPQNPEGTEAADNTDDVESLEGPDDTDEPDNK